jgi:hypothetical protein
MKILIVLLVGLTLLAGCGAPLKPPEPPAPPQPAVAQMEQVPPLPALSPDGVPIGPAIWTVVGREFIVYDITGRELLRRPVGVPGIYMDLEWDASTLWAAYHEEGKLEVHRIDPASGYILLRLKVPGADGVALSKDGMWVSNTSSNRLYLLNPTNGEPLREVVMGDPGAITWDGTMLWIVQQELFRIHSYDPQVLRGISTPLPIVTKSEEKPAAAESAKAVTPPAPVKPSTVAGFIYEIITPGPNTTSLSWNGEYLMAADPDAGKVFFLNPKTGEVAGQLFVRGVLAACWQPALAVARPDQQL